MGALLAVAGGLFVSVLAVGTVLYVALGGDLDMEWEHSNPGNDPEN